MTRKLNYISAAFIAIATLCLSWNLFAEDLGSGGNYGILENGNGFFDSGGIAPGPIYMRGNNIYFDGDDDSYFKLSVDDVVDLYLGGGLKITYGASEIDYAVDLDLNGKFLKDSTGAVLVGTTAVAADFPYSRVIISESAAPTTDSTFNYGLVVESTAHDSRHSAGVTAYAVTNGAFAAHGIYGLAKVNATADTAAARGVVGDSSAIHAGGANVGLYGTATNGGSNYALWLNAGDITNAQGIDWDLKDNAASSISFDTVGKAGILNLITLDGSERLETSTIFQWPSKSELFSNADSYITMTNDAGTDFTMLRWGGTSSAFPGIKRSGAALVVRKADDSGDGDLYANNFIATQDVKVAATRKFHWNGRTELYSPVDDQLRVASDDLSRDWCVDMTADATIKFLDGDCSSAITSVTITGAMTVDDTTTGSSADSPALTLSGNHWNDPNNYQCDMTWQLDENAGNPYAELKVDDTCAAGAGTLTSSIKVYDNTLMLPTQSDAAPAEPIACSATTFGAIQVVNDTDDTATSTLCYCGQQSDDSTYDWLQVADNAACPHY